MIIQAIVEKHTTLFRFCGNTLNLYLQQKQ